MTPLAEVNGIVSQFITASLKVADGDTPEKKTEIISKKLLSEENSILRTPVHRTLWGSVCHFFRGIFYSQKTCQLADMKESLASIRDVLLQANATSCNYALDSEQETLKLNQRFRGDGQVACREFTICLDNAFHDLFPAQEKDLHSLIEDIQKCLPGEIVPVLHKEKNQLLKKVQDAGETKELFAKTDEVIAEFETIASKSGLTPAQQHAAMAEFKKALTEVVKKKIETNQASVEAKCADAILDADTMQKYTAVSQDILAMLNHLGDDLPAASRLSGIVDFYKERGKSTCQEVGKKLGQAPIFAKASDLSLDALRKLQGSVLKGELPLDRLLELKSHVQTELATYETTLRLAADFKDRPKPRELEERLQGCKNVHGMLKMLALAIDEKLDDVPEGVKKAQFDQLQTAYTQSKGTKQVGDMTAMASFASKCPQAITSGLVHAAGLTDKIGMQGIFAGGALISLLAGGVLLGGLSLTGAALYSLGAVGVYGAVAKSAEKLPGMKQSEIAPVVAGVLAVALYAYYTPSMINWLSDAVSFSTAAFQEGVTQTVNSTVDTVSSPIVDAAVKATVPAVVQKVTQQTCPVVLERVLNATVPEVTFKVVEAVVPNAVNQTLHATLPNVVSTVVQNTVPAAVNATVTDVVTSSVPQVVSFVYDKCMVLGLNSTDCQQVVSLLLTPQIMGTLRDKLTPELISRLSHSLTPELLQELSSALTPTLIKELVGKLTPELMQKLFTALTPELIKNLQSSMTPELVKQLSANLTPELIMQLKAKLPQELIEKLMPLFIGLKMARTWHRFSVDLLLGTGMLAGGLVATPFTGPFGLNIAGQGIGKLFGTW